MGCLALILAVLWSEAAMETGSVDIARHLLVPAGMGIPSLPLQPDRNRAAR